MTTLCSVRCSPKPNLFISADDGYLSLHELQPLSFVVQYVNSSMDWKVELESILLSNVDNSCVLRSCNKGADVKLFIINAYDYYLFAEAVSESSQIVNLTLQLNSTVRDIYFANVYNILNINEDTIFGDELILANQGRNMDSNELIRFRQKPSTLQLQATSTCKKSFIDISKATINCVYCESQKAVDPSITFVVHPYVCCNYDLKPLFLCMTCAENWQEYREKAIRDDLLVLEGEFNEEICSVCSNMPDELVLCSKCPRSYCHPCLEKIVNRERYNEIVTDSDADWLCLSCFANQDSVPEMSKNMWRVVRGMNLSNVGAGKNRMALSDDPVVVSSRHERAANTNNGGLQSGGSAKTVAIGVSTLDSQKSHHQGGGGLATTRSADATKITCKSSSAGSNKMNNPSSKDSEAFTRADKLKLLAEKVNDATGEIWTTDEMSMLTDIFDKRNWRFGSEILRDVAVKKYFAHKQSLRAIIAIRSTLQDIWIQTSSGSQPIVQMKALSSQQSGVRVSATSSSSAALGESVVAGSSPSINRTSASISVDNRKRMAPVTAIAGGTAGDSATSATASATNVAKGTQSHSTNNNKRKSRFDGASNQSNSVSTSAKDSAASSLASTPKAGPGSKRRNRNKHTSAGTSADTSTAASKSASMSSEDTPFLSKITETFYFGQYVQLYDASVSNQQSLNTNTTTADTTTTEDSCFLCKDGGELIECDYQKNEKQQHHSCRCRKVYHQDCLDYLVPENYKRWICPRHFCDGCGSEELKYACKYCPLSICESCPETIVRLVIMISIYH